MIQTTIAIPIFRGSVALTINSNNTELVRMIELNWKKEQMPIIRHLEVTFLDGYKEYTITRNNLNCWICTGVNNYSRVKNAIRGIMSDAQIDNTIFVHGCSFDIGLQNQRCGFLLTGASGAGKTTLTSLIAKRYPFRIINDDWGAVDMQNVTAVSTEEKYLSMKLSSIKAMSSFLTEDDLIMKEVYHDGIRGFIEPSRVYDDRVSRSSLDAWIILIKDKSDGHYVKKMLSEDAAKVMAEGAFSPYYKSVEKFMNGSLILDTEEQRNYHLKSFITIMDKIGVYVINNTGTFGDLISDFECIIGENKC